MHSTAKQQKPQSSADSFFGMALAQAFLGVAYGADMELAWEAGEALSARHQDKHRSKFALGAKRSISDAFGRIAEGIEEPARAFGLFAAPPAPARAFGF